VKALVTGGGGFIGHHLAIALVRDGHDVTVLDDFSTGDRTRLLGVSDDIRLVEGDVRDPAVVDNAVRGCEVVFHQAALPSVARSIVDPVATNDVNTNGSIQVMRAAARAGVRRVVYAGSSSVYGDSPLLPRREDQPPAPMSPYAISKAAAEQYIHVLGRLGGVSTVVLRYFNIFGPGQDPASQYSAVVPKFITAALQGDAIHVHGDGRQSRDFTYVANVVSANLLAADAAAPSGVTANIGCGGQFSLLDLIDRIERALDVDIEPIFGAPRAGDVPHSCADISVAGETLGYTVVVPFDEGIRLTADWYRDRLRA
jgi:nucleoside-diphosphate-sugar epimerase